MAPDHHAKYAIERRANTRYPLRLEVRYSTSPLTPQSRMEVGRTIDLSSAGLSFTAHTAVLVGQKVTVFIDWPAMLDQAVKLQLVILGEVVRTTGTEIALRIKRHDFRTRCAGQPSANENARGRSRDEVSNILQTPA